MPDRPRHKPRPAETFDVRRPFTRAEAREARIQLSELRTTRYRRLMVNVYVAAEVAVTPRLRALAPLALAHPTAWASHASATRVHGLPIPTLAQEHVSVCKPEHRLRRSGVVSHLASKTCLVVEVDGCRVSSPAQTFVELGELLDLVDLVVVGDHLVRKGAFTPDQLVEFCKWSRHPGAWRAAVAAGYVRERVDSPMETRLRMLIVLAGLPEPQVNLTISDAAGFPVRRYDLSWPEVKAIVEYDGRHHIEREQQWESDLERREAIDDEGHRLLVVTSKGIYVEPGRTLERVHRLLLERRLPGVPAKLDDAWRAHFPGRADAA